MIYSFVFDQGKVAARDLDLDALRLVRGDPGLHVWVDLDRPTDAEVKDVLEGVFGFHPLAVEDCVMVSQLPKIEDYESYLFMVIHAVDFKKQEKFQTTELDFFLGKQFLVTYHTAPLRSITNTIERVKSSAGFTARGPDRLAHTILDQLVDNYKPVIDELGEEIQMLEEQAINAENSKKLMNAFLEVKAEVRILRQILRPQKEVLYRLAHGEFKMIRVQLLPYFRDIYDHLLRTDEMANGYSDQLYLALDVYLNRASAETNEVIKLLTMLTAVTTPLMVIGTWYGMNFQGMPELHTPHGYWLAITITILSTIGLMVWLKLKKWI